MASFRDRCRAFLATQQNRAIMRVGDPVQELMEFVLAETGRAAAPNALEDTVPIVLYFENDAMREDFIAMVHQINPGMTARKVN